MTSTTPTASLAHVAVEGAGSSGRALKGCKRVHMFGKVRYDGAVSAACFNPPRAIDLKRATWSFVPGSVTCPNCRGANPPRQAAEVFAPHEFIREELTARGWGALEFANAAGIRLKYAVEIIEAKRPFGLMEAQATGRAFGTSERVWMRLEWQRLGQKRTWSPKEAEGRRMTTPTQALAALVAALPLAHLLGDWLRCRVCGEMWHQDYRERHRDDCALVTARRVLAVAGVDVWGDGGHAPTGELFPLGESGRR